MEESIREAISPALVEFCDEQHRLNRNIRLAKAAAVAVELRGAFNIPWPFTFEDRARFLHGLRYPNVFARPGLERETNTRGVWGALGDQSWILIDDGRPTPSQLKTLVHELGEQALTYSASLLESPRDMTNRERESWCNGLAAHVKMPPEFFVPEAVECGLDLWWLKERNDDTIAGVSRQIRDVVMANSVFYVCRFDIVHNAQRYCEELVPVVEASGGVCIRVADVARTRRMDLSRRCGGGLPLYNLPASDHYRVLHPAMHEYARAKEPVFIPSLKGAAGLEFGYQDLFADQDLAVLIRPYGRSRTKGFVLLAVHANEAYRLDPQLERISPDVRRDIPWLFSWASVTKKRGKSPLLQTTLNITDSKGKGLMDMGSELLRWPCQPQSVWAGFSPSTLTTWQTQDVLR